MQMDQSHKLIAYKGLSQKQMGVQHWRN